MTGPRGRRFELRDHTADVAVAATGETLEDVFGAVADGLAAASCDEIPDGAGERFSLSVTAENREALLFDYLDELIYRRDVRVQLPVDHRVERIDGSGTNDPDADEDEREWTLEASARGVPLTEVDAREVKAVTYSEMRLERVDAGAYADEDTVEGPEDGDCVEGLEDGDWEAYVVFDV